MLSKTRGIVLRITPYGEASVVCKIYTEVYGLQSYLVNSVRNNKGIIKAGLLQPLNVLEMIVYHKPNVGLQRIKEARLFRLTEQIHLDINKACIVMFMLEVLNRSLKEEEASAEIFDFLENAIADLDDRNNGLALFPHYFMIQLAGLLGFSPEREHWRSGKIFDLTEGRYIEMEHIAHHYINTDGTELMYNIEKASFPELDHIIAPKKTRKDLLEQLIKYYQFHICGSAAFNSHLILQQIVEPKSVVANGI